MVQNITAIQAFFTYDQVCVKYFSDPFSVDRRLQTITQRHGGELRKIRQVKSQKGNGSLVSEDILPITNHLVESPETIGVSQGSGQNQDLILVTRQKFLGKIFENYFKVTTTATTSGKSNLEQVSFILLFGKVLSIVLIRFRLL